ncbi:MAG: hypothetical protein H7A38_04440 [Chlamydiales bacterium]|nr:hypothetical protein [Chlamydiales bacterium]
MAPIINFIKTESPWLALIAAVEGNHFYQEYLRGTELSAMAPAYLGREAYSLMQGSQRMTLSFSRMIAGLGLAWAVSSYRGLNHWSWAKNWASVAFFPATLLIIRGVTPNAELKVIEKNSDKGIDNPKYSQAQDRIRWFLSTAAVVAKVCVCVILEGERNGSLPLKPYFYHGTIITCLAGVERRYVEPKLMKGLSDRGYPYESLGGFVSMSVCINAMSLGNMVVAAWVAKRVTGHQVQFSKTCAILSGVAHSLACRYIFSMRS